jgi:acyl carrier protein
VSEPDVPRLAELFAGVTGSPAPAPDADLVQSGVLDSLALVELLFAIEQELGITIPSDRLEIERFRTLELLAELVGECRALGSSDAA